jgi:hypothetical protein
MLLDPNRAMMVLIHLWHICDPGMAYLHPDNAFEECLLYLVQCYMDDLVAPVPTR